MESAKKSAFSFKIFTVISESCTALLRFNFLISLRRIFLLNLFIKCIPGWFLCSSIVFKVGCLDKLWKASSHKFLWNLKFFNNIQEIVVEGICYLLISRFNFLIFTKVFFPLIYFSEREKAWQFAKISCYQWYFFRLGLQNIPFLLFLEVIQKSFFVFV